VNLTNVKTAMCGMYACVAVKEDNTAVAWGHVRWGGDATGVNLTNVKTAMCGMYTCVALKYDNTVVAWGGEDKKGVDAYNRYINSHRTDVKSAHCGTSCVVTYNDPPPKKPNLPLSTTALTSNIKKTVVNVCAPPLFWDDTTWGCIKS